MDFPSVARMICPGIAPRGHNLGTNCVLKPLRTGINLENKREVIAFLRRCPNSFEPMILFSEALTRFRNRGCESLHLSALMSTLSN